MNIFVHWINENGGVSFAHMSHDSHMMNVIMPTFVSDPEIATPPLSGTILPGVTRKSLLELGAAWVKSYMYMYRRLRNCRRKKKFHVHSKIKNLTHKNLPHSILQV